MSKVCLRPLGDVVKHSRHYSFSELWSVRLYACACTLLTSWFWLADVTHSLILDLTCHCELAWLLLDYVWYGFLSPDMLSLLKSCGTASFGGENTAPPWLIETLGSLWEVWPSLEKCLGCTLTLPCHISAIWCLISLLCCYKFQHLLPSSLLLPFHR